MTVTLRRVPMVLSAATIRSELEGVEVVGVRDGFEWLMQGNIDHVVRLTIEGVSRIHFRGGSHIGISRSNPTRDPAHLENTVLSLLRLNVEQLITIGGDDTAYSALKLQVEPKEEAGHSGRGRSRPWQSRLSRSLTNSG